MTTQRKKNTIIIIHNGLQKNGSWVKRVKNWNLSFGYYGINSKIITVYPKKPLDFKNGVDNIFYLTNLNINTLLLYILSPFILLKYLITEKPDAVLLTNGGFLEYYTIPLYCKIWKRPLIVDVVDTIGRKHKKRKTFSDYIVILNKKLFDWTIVVSCNALFVISSKLKVEYEKLLSKKDIYLSIPTSVNIDTFDNNSKLGISFLNNKEYDVFNSNDYIKIFYAGTITRLNGIEFFLNIFSNIIKERKVKAKVIFAILNGNDKKLLSLIEKHCLESHSIIVPQVEQQYLPILLKHSDILFIPEQGIDTANMGFPGKTSEYLMSGNPVITTRFSDLDCYLKNGVNAYISDIGDYTSYKKNLVRLILNKDLRLRIGNEGRKLAIKYFSHYDSAYPYIVFLKKTLKL